MDLDDNGNPIIPNTITATSNQDIALDPEVEQKSQKNATYLIIGIIVIFGLILSINYIRDTKLIDISTLTGKTITRATEESYSYKGLEFSKVDGIWYTDILSGNNLYTVGFHNDPLSVKDIDIKGRISEAFVNSDIYYVTFDPTTYTPGSEALKYVAVASGELKLSMERAMHLKIKGAYAKPYNDTTGTPVITCGSTDKPVFYLKDQEPTQILFDNNCIVVQGKGPELVRALDRLLYFWYGIMVE
jgi:hypothetical protein